MAAARVANGGEKSTSVEEYPDGRSYDCRAVKQITQKYIDFHMKARESEYTKATSCSVFCGTWNVNAKKLDGGLEDWLLPSNQPYADVYAIGFQEIVDLNAMNVALNSNNTQQRAVFWQERISQTLYQTKQPYRIVVEKYLVGLYLIIYVKTNLYDRISDIRTTSLGVGIMGMMGNKGGVAIRFALYDSTLVFVCAHLAAHRENVAGRNSDYRNIYDRSVFLVNENAEHNLGHSASNDATSADSVNGNAGGSGSGGGNVYAKVTEGITMPQQGASRYFRDDLTISDHDLVFWIGDLNYRIDDSMSTEEVFERLNKKDIAALRQIDQLNMERSKGKVFQDFQEGILNFFPTYKYQPGTDSYETRAEKKLRAPAWCDRVLWKAKESNKVQQLSYNRANLLPSDHKPVYAFFQVGLKRIETSRERAVFEEMVTFLNKFTSIKQPVVEVTGLKIVLGKIEYDEKYNSVITLKNTGESIAHWRFVNKMDENRPAKQWISFDNTAGLLIPGEETQITLTVRVDMETARMLNAGKDILQDAIILRIEKCLDQYIEVAATYERSCFGVSLDDLVGILVPVATTPLPADNPEFYLNQPITNRNEGSTSEPPVASTSNTISNTTTTKLSIPKELWRLIDALWSGHALKEKDLFNTVADVSEVKLIRKALDNGLEFPPNLTPHAYVECLISFLRALPKPLLPPDLYPMAEVEDRQLNTYSRRFLEELPPLHYNVFVYVLSFLREVLAEESYNRCSAVMLSAVCIQCMTPIIPPESSGVSDRDNMPREEKQRRMSRQGFMQRLIMHLLTTSSL